MNIKKVLWMSNGMVDLLPTLMDFGINVFVPKDFECPSDFKFHRLENLNRIFLEETSEFDMMVIEIPSPSNLRDEEILLNSIETDRSDLVKFCVKNYREIVPVVDREGLERVIHHIEECGDVPLQERRKLSLKALLKLIDYYTKIHSMLSEVYASEKFEHLILEKIDDLLYGENPHQEASIYKLMGRRTFLEGIEPSTRIELSSNNLLNIHEALRLMKHLPNHSAILCAHGSIRAVATSDDPIENVRWVVRICERSRMRGSVVFKGKIDGNIKKLLSDSVYMVVAEDIEGEIPGPAKSVKVRNMSIEDEKNVYHSLGNGFVKFDTDFEDAQGKAKDLDADGKLAVTISKFLRSASAVMVKNGMSIGLVNNASSASEALKYLIFSSKDFEEDEVKGCTVAVDETILEKEILDSLHRIGVETLIEPGGSRKDEELLETAKNLGMKLLFTGVRHFRHL